MNIDRESVIRMAREAFGVEIIYDNDIPRIERFAALVAAAEREECAKVCDPVKGIKYSPNYLDALRACAAAIRARGQA